MKSKIVLLFVLLFTAAQSFSQDKFIGNWENADKSFVVQIYEDDSQYYAKVIKSIVVEEVGNLVLMQMEKKSAIRLYGGTYQKHNNQPELEASLKLVDADTIRMKIVNGFFSKTTLWHRVKILDQEKPKTAIALQKI